MIRHLRTLLTHFTSTCYVLLDGETCVDVLTSLQGAEEVRADHARKLADRMGTKHFWELEYKAVYDRQRIENHELRDM